MAGWLISFSLDAVRRMTLAGLKIVAPPSWLFHEFEHFVLARPDTALGSLQVSTAYRHNLPSGASAAECFSLARQFVSRDGMSDPFDISEVSEHGSLFGGFSYNVGNDFGRVWYHFFDRQLLLGVYRSTRDKVADATGELQQAEQIMRASWYTTPSI